jgi:uncharacterized membrane protein YphA (DoxX/SURF4 family)
MNDSMAHEPRVAIVSLELAGWKNAAAWLAAILLGVIFLVAGIWKITDAPAAAVRMAQARVPESLSLFAAISFGIVETFAGVLILVPRFRRWGAWLSGLLLAAFLVYIGYHYQALRGEECSCFPWVKRAVGPGFFIGDAVMMGFAAVAGAWARPSQSKRSAVLVLSAVTVFALVSYGVAAARNTATPAPASITVEDKPFSLQEGKILLYFFDPECLHCDAAAREMARFNWGETKVVGLATAQPQFAREFMNTTGLRGGLSPDAASLRKIFPFVDTPAAVALVDGRQQALITRFEGEEPEATLKKLGLIY